MTRVEIREILSSIVVDRSWQAYPPTYRSKEIRTLAGWILSGQSGSVVGLSGCGRSNLLGFLCYRPEVFRSYLLPRANPVALIPVDINNLPAINLSTLYRVILRSFDRVSDQFDSSLQQKITDIYKTICDERDPFLTQSALLELLLACQLQKQQVVLVMNRFDRFCQMATQQMVNTLRGLRDEFKDTLCYIAGMTQEVAYMPDPSALGQMYELLDNHICWVGAMSSADGRNLIDRAVFAASMPPSSFDVETILTLSGAYPALLRGTCDWWLTTENRPPHDDWGKVLLAERSIQHRLTKIWNGLTQEEQYILVELHEHRSPVMREKQVDQDERNNSNDSLQESVDQHTDILTQLTLKGTCHKKEGGWQFTSSLLSAFVANIKGRGRGRVWLDEETGEIYQGQILLTDLTTLERAVLSFLIKNPRIKHTKTDLIVSTWPEETRKQGVTDNSLYQVIFAIRKIIEPNPSEPLYLINWRGKPEGGYQFFPEGRPK